MNAAKDTAAALAREPDERNARELQESRDAARASYLAGLELCSECGLDRCQSATCGELCGIAGLARYNDPRPAQRRDEAREWAIARAQAARAASEAETMALVLTMVERADGLSGYTRGRIYCGLIALAVAS